MNILKLQQPRCGQSRDGRQVELLDELVLIAAFHASSVRRGMRGTEAERIPDEQVAGSIIALAKALAIEVGLYPSGGHGAELGDD